MIRIPHPHAPITVYAKMGITKDKQAPKMIDQNSEHVGQANGFPNLSLSRFSTQYGPFKQGRVKLKNNPTPKSMIVK